MMTRQLYVSPHSLYLDSSLPTSVPVGQYTIPFNDSASNLGFILDSGLSMKTHIKTVYQLTHCDLRRTSYLPKRQLRP